MNRNAINNVDFKPYVIFTTMDLDSCDQRDLAAI